MKKRLLTALLVSVLLVSLFTGCSKNDVSETGEVTKTEEVAVATDDQSTEEAAPVKQSGKLSIIASQDWIQEAEIELGKAFEAETGYEVDYQIYPADQYFNVLLTKMNAGEELDIFMSQSGAFDIVTQLDIVNNGVALNDESWVSRFEPLAIEQLSVDGVLYGQTVADTYSTWAVGYNKTLFESLGIEIPTDYASFMAASQVLLDNGVTPIFESVSDGWHHTLWWHEVGPVYETNEPGIYDALNKNSKKIADFQGPKMVMAQMKEMVDKGYWGEDYMSNQYANAAAAIASGDYAMTLVQQNFGGQVEAEGKGLTADDIGYFVIPLLDNQTLNLNPAGPSRFIYSESENIEIAKAYFDFVARQENLQSILDNSDRYSNLPFEGLVNKYTNNVKDFYERYSNKGTVLQTAVKYINPQWMDTGADITSYLLELSTVEDAINSIDQRRTDQATAAGDSDWE